MNILLVNLPRYNSVPVVREERCEYISKKRVDTPATLLIMAALLREMGNQIYFIDANALNLSYEDISDRVKNKKIDCLIFPFCSRILDNDLIICDIVKRFNPSCLTIGYSWYSRFFAKEILTEYPNLDVQITGMSLSVIGNLVRAISENRSLEDVDGIAYRGEDNEVKVNSEKRPQITFDDLPMPAYDLLPSFKPYYVIDPFLSPYALVYSSRGCPFGCNFCNVARTKYSGRSPDGIIKELQTLEKIGIKYVWFYDECFTLDRERIVNVCERILEEDINIKWFCDSRVDLVDEKLLKLMRKGGCIGIAYGVESGSQKILNLMNKGTTVEQAEKALIWTREAHIPVVMNLVLGYIGEDEKTLKETESFIRTTLPERLQIVILVAEPGTEFTKLAINKKWVNHDIDWKQWLTTGSDLNNYAPFDLDLNNEVTKMRKALYYNPKWWLTCIKTLIWNRHLILPTIGILLRRHARKNYLASKAC